MISRYLPLVDEFTCRMLQSRFIPDHSLHCAELLFIQRYAESDLQRKRISYDVVSKYSKSLKDMTHHILNKGQLAYKIKENKKIFKHSCQVRRNTRRG